MRKYIKNCITLNKYIYENKLSLLNFGNASVIDRKNSIVYIKASGVLPNKVNNKNIVGIKLLKNNSYKVVYNKNLKPSVDLSLHIRIFNYYKKINSIIHVHSCFGTILAQSQIEPKCIGTTHADFHNKSIPLSAKFKLNNHNQYDDKMFLSIKTRLKKEKNFPPGILLRSHGVLAWGNDINKTIENAVAIEFISQLYYHSLLVKKNIHLNKNLIDFHYYRKNGKNKRYGQDRE